MPSHPTPMNLYHFFVILRRRKWSLILPVLFIFVAVAAVARMLPPIYKSTSTILVEDQEVPTYFVKATVTGYAEQRIQTINQRIMSSSKLLDIISRFNLYPELRERLRPEQIVENMRKNIRLDLISADSSDRRSSKSSSATIAFTLSYEGKNPDTVQRVANELAALFLSENLQVRERKSLQTSQFIEDEMKKVKASLVELDDKIASFKIQHFNELPDLLQVNQQSLNNVENDIARLTEQSRSLKDKKQQIQTQLKSTPPKLEMPYKNRLEELKLELINLQTRFTEHHPSVIKTKEEIAEIEKELTEKGSSATPKDTLPDNPVYLTLASQLARMQADIESIYRQIEDLEDKASTYRSRIEATPRVEEAYRALLIEQSNLQAKYSDLMRKLMEARVAYGLEKEQVGERFTLLEPASFPVDPYKPNRMLILLVGLVLGLGAGGTLVYLRENMDHSVHDAFSLSIATSSPVLATIPEFRTQSYSNPSRLKTALISATLLLVIIGVLVTFR